VRKLGLLAMPLLLVLSGCFLRDDGDDAAPRAPVYPAAINIQGDLTVNGASYVRGNLSDCAGAGPYADVIRGAPVLVTNQNKRPVAIGRVAYGIGTNVYRNRLDQCTFRFRVAAVPRQQSYYISVGRQQPQFITFPTLYRYAGTLQYSLPPRPRPTTTTLSPLIG
jgi:hypothetical protein